MQSALAAHGEALDNSALNLAWRWRCSYLLNTISLWEASFPDTFMTDL